MPTVRCEACDTELPVDVDDVLAHYTEAHPQFGLTERQVRNYLERMPMLTGAKERQAQIGEVELVPIAPDRVEDVLAFFDHDAFADNASWASCYCMAHHVPGGETGTDWGDLSWEENRRALAERVRNGTTKGVLAYDGGRVVAWCNASARCQYPDYARGADDETTGVVTCFAVAPSHRGHGLARRMLAASVEQFSADGVTAVEGHPAKNLSRPGSAYRGTIPLFADAGFAVVHEGEHTTIVRRDLP